MKKEKGNLLCFENKKNHFSEKNLGNTQFLGALKIIY